MFDVSSFAFQYGIGSYGALFWLMLICILLLLREVLRSKKPAHLIMRILAITVLFIGLLGPKITSLSPEKVSYPVLVDISDSMNAEVVDRSLALIKSTVAKDAELLVYPFAADVAPISESVQGFHALKSRWGNKLDTTSTDLARAFKVPVALESEIFLISDGHSAIEITDNLEFKGPVVPVLVEYPKVVGNQILLTALEVPSTTLPNIGVIAKVNLRNPSTTSQSAELVVSVGGKPTCRVPLSLAAGGVETVPCKFTTPRVGPVKVEAYLSGAKQPGESEYIAIQSSTRALLLGSSQSENRFVREILEHSGLENEQIILAKDGESKVTNDFSAFSFIILNNVPYSSLGEGNAQKLVQAVRDGVGLVTIGGDRSFGLGKYHESTLEEVMAVRSVPPRAEIKRLPVAIVLVLDKSSSMQGDNLLYARQSAEAVIQNLKDEDYISVIGFDENPFVVIRPSKVRDIRARSSQILSRIVATHSSNLPPALEQARQYLTRLSARRKHIVVLSDGAVRGNPSNYVSFGTRINSSDITVSTILVGSGETSKLETLAHYGGGKFYETRSANSLPRIFIKDVEVATGEQTMHEGTEYFPRATPSLDAKFTRWHLPSVTGYVETKPFHDSKVLYDVGSINEPSPFLATRKVGDDAISVALTTDMRGAWSRKLLEWESVVEFWREIFAIVTPATAQDQALNFDLRHSFQHGKMNLQLAVFNPSEAGGMTVLISDPDGQTTPASVLELAEGSYSVDFPARVVGDYGVRLTMQDRSPAVTKVSVPSIRTQEILSEGYNIPLLQKIASNSGGELLSSPTSTIIDSRPRTTKKHVDLSMIFGFLGLLLWLVEIFLRERGRRQRTIS